MGTESSSYMGATVAAFSVILPCSPVHQVVSEGYCQGFFWSSAFSWAVIAFASPTSATSVGTFVPISSGLMSIWMMRTFGLKRGGDPKCIIQFRRAPISRTTSAFWRANDRAGAIDCVWSSGMTPLPIGDARYGSPVVSTNFSTSSSAREYAEPLPMITNGRSADFKAAIAASMFSCGAQVRGASGHLPGQTISSSSIVPVMMSPERSR